MAEALSERELRAILRTRARERQLQEDQERRNALVATDQERSHRPGIEQMDTRDTYSTERNKSSMDAEGGHYDIQQRERSIGERHRSTEHRFSGAHERDQFHSDNSDGDSDLNTIDEFLHESTTKDIQDMELHRYASLRHDKRKLTSELEKEERRNSLDSNLAFIDKEMEQLSNALRVLRDDDETCNVKGNEADSGIMYKGSTDRNIDEERGYKINSQDDREIMSKLNTERNVEGEKEYYMNTYVDRRYESSRKGITSERSHKTTEIKEKVKSEHDIDNLAGQLTKTRNENYELRSQSSRYERESLKLRKLQLEEEKKQQLMLEKERLLQEEIKTKKKAETELLQRIKSLEDQETDLNSIRNENERLERGISAKRYEDKALSQKIALLKEKERLMKEKVDNKEKLSDSKDKRKTKRDRPASEKIEKEKYPTFKLGSPKIPSFNGTHFENWKMEVTCLLQTHMYPDYAIVQAIRNSLKDETRQVLLTLKATATSKEIMDKLSEIYGDIKTEDTIVQDFYSAKQRQGESISVWGIRVETLFQKAVDKGEIDESKRDKKLKERFWRGLRSDKLKVATRVSYESTDTFEKLRRKARQEEEEENEPDKEKSEQVNVSALQEKKIDEKLGILQELLERMKTMETDLGKLKHQSEHRRSNNQGHNPPWRPFRGGYRGRSRNQEGFRGSRDEYKDTNQRRNQEQSSESKVTDGKKKNEKQALNREELSPKGSMEAQKKQNAQQ